MKSKSVNLTEKGENERKKNIINAFNNFRFSKEDTDKNSKSTL